MPHPANVTRRFCLALAAMVCFAGSFIIVSAESGQDQFSWKDDGHHNISGVKVIIADMENLNPTSTSILEFNEASADFVSLLIRTPTLENVESCTHLSNRLLLQIDSVFQSAPLICGNEVATIHVTKFPFKLVFVKGSGVSLSQLNKFNITVDRTTAFPHDKYKNLALSPFPRILYSPLYPDIYGGDLDLTTTLQVAKPVLFQLRTRRAKKGSCNALKLKTDDEKLLCGDDLVTMVKEPTGSEFGLQFDVTGNTEEVYEMEYRSVKMDSFQCNDIATYDVKEPTVVTYGIGENEERCDVTFTAKPSQALSFRSLSQKSCAKCKNVVIELYMGDKMLPMKKQKGFPNFGSVRVPPGTSVKMLMKYERYTNANYIKFLVEPHEADGLPEALNAHVRMSYIWTPGSNASPQQAVHQVRSVKNRCVKFSVLDESMSPNSNALSAFVSLYSGSGSTRNFKLTETCLGAPKQDSVIDNLRYELTTAVTESSSPFWFIISELGKADTPCPVPEVQLERASSDMSSLFPRVTITRHMDCLFVVPPIESNPAGKTGTKFRGHLSPRKGAELYAKFGHDAYSTTLADFQQYTGMAGWYFTEKTVYLHFQTQFDISDNMAKFEYMTRYSSTDIPQPTPACPGPKDMSLTTDGDVQIDTPDYPNHMEENMHCMWKLERPANGTKGFIHVSTSGLSLPCSTSTKLEIQSNPSDVPNPPEICGSEYYQVFAGDVEIKLEGGGDHFIPGVQFNVKYEGIEYDEVCDKTYVVKQESAGMRLNRTFEPGHYIAPYHCKIYLDTRDSGAHLNVSIPFGESSKCKNAQDALTIYDGVDTSSTKLTPDCDGPTGHVQSSSHRLLIEMTLKETVDHPVTYELSVGRIETSEQIWRNKTRIVYASEDIQYLTSPGYPQDYGKTFVAERLWEIKPVTDHQVEIEIEDLHLDEDVSCSRDSVLIYDGSNTTAPVLGRACGDIYEKLRFRSSDKVLYIRFRPDTDDLSPLGKFRIGYYTRLSPSDDLEDGKNRTYNGHGEESDDHDDHDDNDDNDDNDGKEDATTDTATTTTITTTIIIIIVLVCFFILLVLLLVVCIVRRKRKAKAEDEEEADRKEAVPLNADDKKPASNGVTDPLKAKTTDGGVE